MRDLFNKISNVFVKSPLHGLVSGQKYTTPVQYVREGTSYIFFTNKGRRWWKNLMDGHSVILRIKGEDFVGRPQVVDDTPTIEQWFK